MSKTLINIEENVYFEHLEKSIEIPYKTCGTLMNLVPKSQIGIQMHRKALGFSLKVTWRFAMSKNLIKPVENCDSGDTQMGKIDHLASLGWRT